VESLSDRKTSPDSLTPSPTLPSSASSTSTSDSNNTAAVAACLRPTAIRDFFALSPPDVQIAHTAAYRSGQVYGIDVASGACVAALGRLRATDRVLDLCCAPGAGAGCGVGVCLCMCLCVSAIEMREWRGKKTELN
jgi:16S rRNA C967 or C1407 C5-methylase (RsmB/RsmF family)